MIRRFINGVDDYTRLRELSRLYPVPCSDEEFASKVYFRDTWVYELNGKIEALIIVTLQDGEPYIWLAVTSLEHRNEGLASSLLDHVIEQYSISTIWMHVDAENPAQTLYFKKGFRVTGVHKNMYGYGRNGLTMTRNYPVGIPKI